MNILMMTNTYKPIVGGLEKSIEVFSSEYRSKGHSVLVIAPVFKNMPQDEAGVYRLPAIQNFNGTDFSVQLPLPGVLKRVLVDFKPDIVHSHHPFLVGDTALRVSSSFNIPMIFTYHTRYEMNTHYVPGDSEALKKFVIELSGGYCDLCDQVIAPSRSIESLLRQRGIKTGITVIPTGINIAEFNRDNGISLRRKLQIPEDVFLVGYLGRIADEKNMRFLTEAVMQFIEKKNDAHFMIAGDGNLLHELKQKTRAGGISEKVHFAGVLKDNDKIDAYHAMDIFVFASKSETQGIVLAEAMASGVPVIGLDAPGVREVVENGVNGFLVHDEDEGSFLKAIEHFYYMDDMHKQEFKTSAKASAHKFDYKDSVRKTLALYREVINRKHMCSDCDESIWASAKRSIEREMDIISNFVKSSGTAFNIKGNGDERKKQQDS